MNKKALFSAYFYDNTDYYLDKLDKFEKGNKFTFNFEAGLFGVTWFFYRKMYLQGIIIFVITILLSLLTSALFYALTGDFNENLNRFFLILIRFVILGFVSNAIYIIKTKKIVERFISGPAINYDVIDNIDINEEVDNKSLNKLRKLGGTSSLAAIGFICFSVLIQLTSTFF